jgi:hypothetical protein
MLILPVLSPPSLCALHRRILSTFFLFLSFPCSPLSKRVHVGDKSIVFHFEQRFCVGRGVSICPNMTTQAPQFGCTQSSPPPFKENTRYGTSTPLSSSPESSFRFWSFPFLSFTRCLSPLFSVKHASRSNFVVTNTFFLILATPVPAGLPTAALLLYCSSSLFPAIIW